MTGADVIAIIVLLTILIAIGVYLLHWLYRHSSKNQSFVRTGFGGERVVMGGGAFVIPIIHDITLVNMNAIPLEIRRSGEQSLITRNKMRIDITSEFYVRVIPTEENVSTAARTLGERTMHSQQLKEIVQGRFVDAMAAVAATMTMEEIHANRNEYIGKVAEAAAQTLGANGLELENASLTSLNQSDISAFNPSNAFDAEGLTQLTEQIEARRKLRNQIENEARIAIKLRDYEAEQRAIEIDRDLEYARIDQQRAIETRRAQQLAEIEEERASSSISIAAAQTRAEQEAERVRIVKDRLLETERIDSANEVRNHEIERHRETELIQISSEQTLDRQRILSRQTVEADRIENDRRIKELGIRARQGVALIEVETGAELDTTRLDSERAVEVSRIETSKAIELVSVARDRDIRISNEQAAAEQEKAAIARRHDIAVERVRTDEEIAQLEIGKQQNVRLAETGARRAVDEAAITADREVDALRVAARNYIERFEIEQRRDVEIVDKERLIAVVNKSIEEAVAKSQAAEAWKQQAVLEEQIVTGREQEIANRMKQIELIATSTRTERETLQIVSRAKSEKDAAEQRALAEIAEASAAEVRYAKDAEGQRQLNEAENMRSDASRRSAIYEHLVRTLPSIIRETVKPMENIESIKILQVDGLPGINSPSEMAGAGGGNGGDGSGGNMTDRVVNSAMKYRTQVAFVDGLMKELGLPLEQLGGAGGMSFRNFPAQERKARDDD